MDYKNYIEYTNKYICPAGVYRCQLPLNSHAFQQCGNEYDIDPIMGFQRTKTEGNGG